MIKIKKNEIIFFFVTESCDHHLILKILRILKTKLLNHIGGTK